MKQVSTAFVKAQKEFSPALKASLNPHFKSKYADLASCVEAVMDALNNHGIGLLQLTHECEDGVIVETLFVHESGEQISGGKLHMAAARTDPQGFMSALTYCRRGSLMAACGIAPEDDDGNEATRLFGKKAEAAPAPAPAKPAKPGVKPANATVGPDEVTAITKLAMTTKTELSAICTAYGIEHLSSLPLNKVSEVVTRLQAKLSTAKE
jgi:ERF superfamily